MYTKREAALELGIDRNTLDKWLLVCDITPKHDPRDTRLRLLSEDDLLTLREHYAESHRAFNGASVHPYTSPADLEARVAALETAIEQLRQRAGWLFSASTEARLATDEQLPPYTPPKRQIASTARYNPTPARPAIPAHLMSIPQWCTLHSRSSKTVWHWKRVGKLPVVVGRWLEGSTRFDEALDVEGREKAHQLAGIAWPCEVCAGQQEEEEETANETPSTYAAVEGAR